MISLHLMRAVEDESRLAGVGPEPLGKVGIAIEGQDLLGQIVGIPWLR